jgi:hypothetical protein
VGNEFRQIPGVRHLLSEEWLGSVPFSGTPRKTGWPGKERMKNKLYLSGLGVPCHCPVFAPLLNNYDELSYKIKTELKLLTSNHVIERLGLEKSDWKISMSVSLCLDMVSIKSLDLDTIKKVVSTVEKNLPTLNSYHDLTIRCRGSRLSGSSEFGRVRPSSSGFQNWSSSSECLSGMKAQIW